MSGSGTAFVIKERKKTMNLDEKIKKSDMDLEKAKKRLARIQKENQQLKELKVKKEKEEKEKRQKALGEFVEAHLGTIDFNDPIFLEFLDCVKSDFVKNESAMEDPVDGKNYENEYDENKESTDENAETGSSGFGY